MYNHQLDTFLKVAELGSFGKAAEALYISVPAAIQQVNLLEERCGLKVFLRSNHGVRLTPAGRSLLEDAKTIIRLSNRHGPVIQMSIAANDLDGDQPPVS